MMYKIKKALIGIFFILLPIDISLGNIIGGMSLINYIMIGYIVIAIIDWMVEKEKRNIFKNKSVNITILLVVMSIISILFNARDIKVVMQETAIYTFWLSSVFFIATMLDDYTSEYRRYIKRCILLSNISILVGYLYTYSIGYTFQGRATIAIGRAADPNYFATNLGIVILLLFYNNLKKRKKIELILLILLIGLLIMTGSRTALLATLSTIGIIIVLEYRKNFTKIILVCTICCFLAILVVLFLKKRIDLEIFERLRINSIIEDKGSLRLEYWKNAINYFYINGNILRVIIGWGFASFGIVLIEPLGFLAAPHNMYIQVWFEMGIIGLLLLSILILTNIKKAILNRNIYMIALLFGLSISGMTLDMILTRYFWAVIFLNNINFMRSEIRDENNNMC